MATDVWSSIVKKSVKSNLIKLCVDTIPTSWNFDSSDILINFPSKKRKKFIFPSIVAKNFLGRINETHVIKLTRTVAARTAVIQN